MGKAIKVNSLIVISCQRKIFIFDVEQLKTLIVEIPPPKIGLVSRENSKTVTETHLNRDEILFLVPSKCGQYIAGATQSKRVILCSTSPWSYLREFSVMKFPTAIAFLPDSSKIIVADKSGDVYDFPVTEDIPHTAESNAHQRDEETGPEPLLGHLSMLLDLAITDDGKFIITCDRDEKIRVSCYPNCYNIHSYCLGHAEFVSHLKLLPNRTHDRLLSSSGDGTIKLWDFLSGKCISTLDVRLQIENILETQCGETKRILEDVEFTFISKFEVVSNSDGSYIVAIALHRIPKILFYKMESADGKFHQLSSMKTTSSIVDILFLDKTDILIYLESNKEQSSAVADIFTVFRLAEDQCSFRQVDDHPVVNFGREYRNKLKETSVWSFDVNTLFKQNKYDNVSDYQRKKQDRLNSKVVVIPVKRKASE